MVHDRFNQTLSVGSLVGYTKKHGSADEENFIAEVIDILEEYQFDGVPNAGRIKIQPRFLLPNKTAVYIKDVSLDSRSVVLLPNDVAK